MLDLLSPAAHLVSPLGTTPPSVAEQGLQPFRVSFRNPAGRRQTWLRFAGSLEEAALSARIALAREYPDGQGGSLARLKMIESSTDL